MLPWPAKSSEIRAKFKELGNLTDKAANDAYTKATNIRYIVKEEKEEYLAAGVTYPRMKYYMDSLLDDDGEIL